MEHTIFNTGGTLVHTDARICAAAEAFAPYEVWIFSTSCRWRGGRDLIGNDSGSSRYVRRNVHQGRGAEERSVLLPITRPDCSCTRLHSRYANSRFIFRHGNWTKNRPVCTNFELQLPTTFNKIYGYNILPARELNPELVNESNWSSTFLTHVVPLHQRGLIILKCFTFIVLIPCYSLHPQKDQQT